MHNHIACITISALLGAIAALCYAGMVGAWQGWMAEVKRNTGKITFPAINPIAGCTPASTQQKPYDKTYIRDPSDPWSYPPDEEVPGTKWWEGTMECDICNTRGRHVVPISVELDNPILPEICPKCHNLTRNPVP